MKHLRPISVVAAIAVGGALAGTAGAQSKGKFTGDPITVAYIGDFESLGTSFLEVPGAIKARRGRSTRAAD